MISNTKFLSRPQQSSEQTVRPLGGRGRDRWRRRLVAGDLVEVRPWTEIRATLGGDGSRDALPFTPEMLPYCGRRFVVSKRIERTCEGASGNMRRIRDTVFLDDLRCDGWAHGGCQLRCAIFWKEAWLKKLDKNAARQAGSSPEAPVDPPMVYPYPCRGADGRYVCQSTELRRATTALSPLDVRCYLRDIRARTYSPGQLARVVSYALFLRLRKYVTGQSYRFLPGRRQDTTPQESLNLQAGDQVRIKSQEEIAETLNQRGENRGLAFTVEMLPFCGQTARVLNRVDRMIDDKTGELMDIKNTVILESVICDGCHILRGGCPRANFHLWREIWLKRVERSDQPTARSSASPRETA
ncbi:MAG TPA: hypothetical protein VMV72_19255 [Verrucomicrobiae bacterium]|nr:hypothetical protein [Verrucomicrobiae bacterium]